MRPASSMPPSRVLRPFGPETSPTELGLNPKVFLAHGEAERAGGERERDENADGHMVQHCLDAADAEPGRADRCEQDDGQHDTAPEPALDQQAFQRFVVQVPPSVVGHRGPPSNLRSSPPEDSISLTIVGSYREGGRMSSPSLARSVRVEVITYVPTQYNH